MGRSTHLFSNIRDTYTDIRHLSNDGVEISPPSHPSQEGALGALPKLDPYRVFVDLEGCNVGFNHFHPMPVTQNGKRLSGQGNMGGVWEWTSSTLERHKGFEPMKLYPAYTGHAPHYPGF